MGAARHRVIHHCIPGALEGVGHQRLGIALRHVALGAEVAARADLVELDAVTRLEVRDADLGGAAGLGLLPGVAVQALVEVLGDLVAADGVRDQRRLLHKVALADRVIALLAEVAGRVVLVERRAIAQALQLDGRAEAGLSAARAWSMPTAKRPRPAARGESLSSVGKFMGQSSGYRSGG